MYTLMGEEMPEMYFLLLMVILLQNIAVVQ